jgi:hypothetical protein
MSGSEGGAGTTTTTTTTTTSKKRKHMTPSESKHYTNLEKYFASVVTELEGLAVERDFRNGDGVLHRYRDFGGGAEAIAELARHWDRSHVDSHENLRRAIRAEIRSELAERELTRLRSQLRLLPTARTFQDQARQLENLKCTVASYVNESRINKVREESRDYGLFSRLDQIKVSLESFQNLARLLIRQMEGDAASTSGGGASRSIQGGGNTTVDRLQVH